MKKILLLIILLILNSCTAKKTVTEYKERIVKDTVNVFKERLVTKQVIDTLLIEKPCDSLGNLKDFEKEIRTEKAKVTLKSVNGNIQVDVNLDSIVNQRIAEYKSTYKSKVDTKEVEIIKFRYPLWLIITAIVSILLNLVLLRIRLTF
ncbi:hypothetical protein H9I45_15200 [Polaribacter haliotis]|uniref:Lipoprotein n=1 Tax=Polaribacter haliotis TaxID=1888915 RepID=A0A7L8AF76_9FLAO|nr:hypothetical protein [Polaribacter haliotis]QOD60666.1 hypothetical protein H9I45_15200 [Polaribacter haliotis]